jgi:hypothetical protein
MFQGHLLMSVEELHSLYSKCLTVWIGISRFLRVAVVLFRGFSKRYDTSGELSMNISNAHSLLWFWENGLRL